MTSRDEPAVRIRRLEDGRSWLGRRRRYEIEHADPDGQVERVTTTEPGKVLGPLIGSSHPADLELYTGAADRAWDGGTGPWCGPPGTSSPPDPAASSAPVDRAAVRRRAEKTVDSQVGTSLSAALTLLGATLEQVGEPQRATEVTDLAGELRSSSTAAARSRVLLRVVSLWEDEAFVGTEPAAGSLTERTVCRILLDRVPDLAAAERVKIGRG